MYIILRKFEMLIRNFSKLIVSLSIKNSGCGEIGRRARFRF